MKKKIIFIVNLLITVIYLFVLASCNNNNTEVRLRILANSNSIIDQEVKLEVKEYLKKYLNDIDIMSLDLIVLENELNDTFEQKIKVERKKVSYEAKTYNNKIIPSGKYDTILITIENGKGKNFWTLLYPEYFNISFEDNNEIEYKSYFYELFKS